MLQHDGIWVPVRRKSVEIEVLKKNTIINVSCKCDTEISPFGCIRLNLDVEVVDSKCKHHNFRFGAWALPIVDSWTSWDLWFVGDTKWPYCSIGVVYDDEKLHKYWKFGLTRTWRRSSYRGRDHERVNRSVHHGRSEELESKSVLTALVRSSRTHSEDPGRR